ncbi:MAG TPA: PEPxxWA-CTERM sorting domain-containing protein [Albitalea sp.]|nr:PEPxxWA-CTERM sorting domain-containing protein [Albitalea sp.]HUG22966.1 PEPxxWA-CTERM sorting domain-containing protein [Albitalea sp.]
MNARHWLLAGLLTGASAVVASQTAVIPEPSTYALMLGGLALVGALARRRAKA